MRKFYLCRDPHISGAEMGGIYFSYKIDPSYPAYYPDYPQDLLLVGLRGRNRYQFINIEVAKEDFNHLKSIKI